MEMLRSKKGFFMSARDWISFFIGLVLLVAGMLPLLNKMGIIGFTLPAFMTTLMAAIFFWIIAIAGLYLVIDGIIEPAGHMIHTTLIILGLVFVLVGLVPILNQFGVIKFDIPFLSNLIVYNIIISIEGLMLMSAGFTMR